MLTRNSFGGSCEDSATETSIQRQLNHQNVAFTQHCDALAAIPKGKATESLLLPSARPRKAPAQDMHRRARSRRDWLTNSRPLMACQVDRPHWTTLERRKSLHREQSFNREPLRQSLEPPRQSLVYKRADAPVPLGDLKPCVCVFVVVCGCVCACVFVRVFRFRCVMLLFAGVFFCVGVCVCVYLC